MALTKADMAEQLFDELGINKREAKELVEAFFEEIRGALQKGEQVKLSGFGNFDLRDKNQRPGRNPKTGEEIPITARRVVTFRPGQKLKARVEAFEGYDDFGRHRTRIVLGDADAYFKAQRKYEGILGLIETEWLFWESALEEGKITGRDTKTTGSWKLP